MKGVGNEYCGYLNRINFPTGAVDVATGQGLGNTTIKEVAMLRAMKEQLKVLAKDENGLFHASLRRAVGKRATLLLEEKLKRIVVLIPDLVTRIHDYWRMQPEASSTKRLGAYMLTYVYLPKDFLPQTEDLNLYGYLDDAYMVAKIYTSVIEDISLAGDEILEFDQKLYPEVKSLQKNIRLVIPKVCLKIDEMVNDLVRGNQQSFFNMVEQS